MVSPGLRGPVKVSFARGEEGADCVDCYSWGVAGETVRGQVAGEQYNYHQSTLWDWPVTGFYQHTPPPPPLTLHPYYILSQEHKQYSVHSVIYM